MVLKHYYDIGIAVGAPQGLVVPVLRDADAMSFARIEQGIREFAGKAKNGTLTLEDLRGGTFTITNGGVFGSLLSTPILNPPQVGILGLHKIEDRPIAVNGQVVDPADDVPRAQLRPPHRRRPRGRAVPGARQGIHRGSGQSPPRIVGSAPSGPVLAGISIRESPGWRAALALTARLARQ